GLGKEEAKHSVGETLARNHQCRASQFRHFRLERELNIVRQQSVVAHTEAVFPTTEELDPRRRQTAWAWRPVDDSGVATIVAQIQRARRDDARMHHRAAL